MSLSIHQKNIRFALRRRTTNRACSTASELERRLSDVPKMCWWHNIGISYQAVEQKLESTVFYVDYGGVPAAL
jgi:hypothetical protein